MARNRTLVKALGTLIAVGLLGATLMADTGAASRYDNQIQTAVTQKLAAKREFSNVKAGVAEGIVTLTGTVDVYQAKLDAAKVARKAGHAQGVRNLVDIGRAECARRRT